MQLEKKVHNHSQVLTYWDYCVDLRTPGLVTAWLFYWNQDVIDPSFGECKVLDYVHFISHSFLFPKKKEKHIY